MLRLCLALGLLLGLAAPARAGWARAPGALPADPVRKLVPAGAELLVLLPRHLLVIEGGRTRRTFALALQTDALVDLQVAPEAWWLLSRRALWRSDDRGFSWRVASSVTSRDKNECLALGTYEGRLVVATRQGVRRAADLTPTGPLGRATLLGAASQDGALLVATPRGMFLHPDRKLPLPGAPLPSAFLPGSSSVWVASDRKLYRCEATCTNTGVAETASLAGFDGSYWAAATDGVRRLSPDGAFSSDASADLGAERPLALATDGNALWLATAGRLYTWSRPVSATAAHDAPVPEPRRAPPAMEAVRRWVVATQGLDAVAAQWRTRARWKAAAPTLGVSLRRAVDDKTSAVIGNSISLSATENRVLIGPDGATRTRSNGWGTDIGVSLSWQLDDLVFNPAELTVSNEIEEQFRLRESVLLDATRLYFDRLRAERQMLAEADRNKREELALRVGELTAELDFYTGGRFSAALAGATP